MKAKRYILPVLAGALAFGGVALAGNIHDTKTEKPKEVYACHQTEKGYTTIKTYKVVAPDFLYAGKTWMGKPSDKDWCKENVPAPVVTPPVEAPAPVVAPAAAQPAPTELPETGAQG